MATVSQPFTITVTITPSVTSIGLSNAAITSGAAGTMVGAVSVVTNPPGGTYAGKLALTGTDAAKFALTNGGVLPCNLVTGAAALTNGSYNIIVNAP